MGEKLKPAEGDKVIFEFAHGKWKMHVKYKSGGISGRMMPYHSLDEAVEDLKTTLDLGQASGNRV